VIFDFGKLTFSPKEKFANFFNWKYEKQTHFSEKRSSRIFLKNEGDITSELF